MFYEFTQNNSGGWFETDKKKGISRHVIIEAQTAYEANLIAEDLGLYFDGVDKGIDCECCGDRWYRADEEYDGKPVPTVNGMPVGDAIKDDWTNGAYIHYYDGTMKHIP